MARPIIIRGNLAYVPLTKGYEAIIDIEDTPLVSAWNWCAHVDRRADGSIRAVYAKRNAPRNNGKRSVLLMHKILAGTGVGMETDHRDGDGLNNCRSNLRVATKYQNQHNARIRVDNKSGAKGVSWSSGKWMARITLNGKLHNLGRFDTIDAASAAYANASANLHQDFGRAK